MPTASGAHQQQQSQAAQAAAKDAPKVVGPNVWGKREEYQLVRHLQSALFGGVYEAKGLTSGREFAIKVLHKSELTKAQETQSIEFCEVPLSEIRFADIMKGDEHVMEAEEHFEDAYCYYVVFDLCRGGDLLEALKQKPHGFDEPHAQFLIGQAAKGLAFLHKRRCAMQDVSLENMLLHVDAHTGYYQVKVCDPGQAVVFDVHPQTGEELEVKFGGLVGKSFRPPELHEQKKYHATKVDSWCLGWSTFYLLTAQPLFMSADPAQKDADWALFQQGDYIKLFQQKSNLCSHVGLDFIFRLMQLEPSRRMSVAECLEHPWLADPKIAPVLAPKELLPESHPKAAEAKAESEAMAETGGTGDSKDLPDQYAQTASLPIAKSGTSIAHRAAELPAAATHVASQQFIPGTSSTGSIGGLNSGGAPAVGTSLSGSIHWVGSSSELPTWASANALVPGSPHGNVHSPIMRVRSPARAPRTSGVMALPLDRRRGQAHQPGSAARNPYLIATAHSPAPTIRAGAPRAGPRATSPIQGSPDMGARGAAVHQTGSGMQFPGQSVQFDSKLPWPTFLTPRSSSRPKIAGVVGSTSPTGKPAKLDGQDGEDANRDRAWAFRFEGDQQRMGSNAANDPHARSRAVSPTGLPTTARVFQNGYAQPTAQVRSGQSPARNGSTVYVTRSPSPIGTGSAVISTRPAGSTIRTPSPVAGAQPMRSTGGGFSWSQAPTTYSPRATGGQHITQTRALSPVGAVGVAPPVSFAWSPDPPSPRTSPRTFSPMPNGGMVLSQGGIRGMPTQPRRSGPT